MSALLPISIVLIWLFIENDTPINAVVGFLFLSLLIGLAISNSSPWKGYFFIFVYAGGLVIIVLYFSSLSNTINSSSVTNITILCFSTLSMTTQESYSFVEATSIFTNSTPEFLSGLLLIFAICFLASQLLLGNSCLRAFQNLT